MENKKISVIIPIYNVEKYLSRCIDSVIKQTFQNWELLAVDDGSNDKSGEILDNYSRKDRRIKVFHIENGGVANARNYGLERARGEYVFFLDSDDWLKTVALERMIAEFSSEIDIVQCCYEEINDQGEQISKLVRNFEFVSNNEEVLKQYFLRNLCQSCWGKLYRKSILTSIRFDSALQVGEDSKFVYQICKKTKGAKILEGSYYCYFIRSGSCMHQKYSEKHIQALKVIDLQLEETKDNKTLYPLVIKCEVILCYDLMKNFLNMENKKEIVSMLRMRILKRKKQILKSALYTKKFRIGTVLLWLLPTVFYKKFSKE